MKLRSLLFITIFAIAAISRAQIPGMPDMFTMQYEPILLLTRGDVLKELHLDKTQSAEIKKITKEYQDQMQAMAKNPPNPNDMTSGLEAMKGFGKEKDEASAKAVAVMNPEQADRFRGLRIQFVGAKILSEPEFAKLLELTEEQIEAIKEIRAKESKESLAVYMEMAKGGRGGDKKVKEFKKQVHESILAKLTPEQVDKLKTMAGKEFGPAKKERGF